MTMRLMSSITLLGLGLIGLVRADDGVCVRN